MKKWYAVLYALMLLSIAAAGICIALMPEQVPMHYNAAGEIDRIGSKYESLFFPAVILLMGGFFAAMARYQRRKEAAGNEKVLLIFGAATLAFENVLFGYFMIASISSAGGPLTSPDMLKDGVFPKFICIGLGLFLCIIGNIMPKIRRNSLLGLRIAWSMKNDQVWRQSQRFAGYSMVVCGLLLIGLSIFLQGNVLMYCVLGLILADAAASVLASYIFYRKDQDRGNRME